MTPCNINSNTHGARVYCSHLLQWEKLQKYSEEVHERAETAECQIAAISQEYRKLIQEKDVSFVYS